MKPIRFKQYTTIYAENQPPYIPLPVYEDDVKGGRVLHCWQLSFLERLKILFTGKLWIHVANFGKKLQPIKPMINNPFKK